VQAQRRKGVIQYQARGFCPIAASAKVALADLDAKIRSAITVINVAQVDDADRLQRLADIDRKVGGGALALLANPDLIPGLNFLKRRRHWNTQGAQHGKVVEPAMIEGRLFSSPGTKRHLFPDDVDDGARRDRGPLLLWLFHACVPFTR
jgi:hypothetical protein